MELRDRGRRTVRCALHTTNLASAPPFRFPSHMRSLFLHVSALNDDEYNLFTSSFSDLVALDLPLKVDDDFEKLTVSIREARAWLRGRYPDLPVIDLDQVRISISTPFNTFLTTVS